MNSQTERLSITLKKSENGIVDVTASAFNELQTELVRQKEENKRMVAKIKQLEGTVAKFKSTTQNLNEERDRLKRKVRELQTKLSAPSSNLPDSDSACSVRWINGGTLPAASSSSTTSSSPPSSPSNNYCRIAVPVAPKLAEKVRLKRLPSSEVHGSEISALGVNSTKLAEHLVEDIEDASELDEMFRASHSSIRRREFKLELEKLRAKADNLKAQIMVLEVSLNESRANSENLSIVCAQLESNQTAFRMVLSYAECIQEIFDCLLMLAETQLSLTLVTCKASEFVSSSSNKLEMNKMIVTARLQRSTAECFANQLCKRLKTSGYVDPVDSPDSELSTSSADCLLVNDTDEGFTLEQEDSLREYCNRLKIRKESVLSTVLPVSAALSDSLEQHYPSSERISTSYSLQEQKLNLENAVLLQELSAMKEGRADLRAQIYLFGKENERFKLSLEAKEYELKSCRVQIDQLSQQLNAVCTDCGNEVDTERSLKKNFADLSLALECLSKNAELRAAKSDDLINDLKRANGALLAGFERSKRKYQNKICKLYQQLAISSERFQLQIKELKSRLNSADADNVIASHLVAGLETVF